MARKLSRIAYVSLVWPIVILLLGFWLPILIWVIQAATVGDALTLYGGPAFTNLLGNTVWIAGLTTAFSIVLAYPISLLWWSSGEKQSTVITSLVFLPLLVGLLARNYSWIGMLSSDSPFTSLGFSLIGAESYLYTMYSVILVMTYIFVPIAFFVLANALSSVSNYEVDAAKTAGATTTEILLKLVLPHTYRQASIGAFLIFANAIGYFVTPRMLGGGKQDMIGNLIWMYTNLGDFTTASSISLTFLLWFSPFYIFSFVLIVTSRKRIIGR